jgi:hypothetical protein
MRQRGVVYDVGRSTGSLSMNWRPGRVLLIPVQAPFGDRARLRDFTARLTAFKSAAAYVTIDYQEALTPARIARPATAARRDRSGRYGSSCPPRSATGRSSSTTRKPSGPPAPRG